MRTIFSHPKEGKRSKKKLEEEGKIVKNKRTDIREASKFKKEIRRITIEMNEIKKRKTVVKNQCIKELVL